jgi:hypothetical protein
MENMFSELPAALVEEMLQNSEKLGEDIFKNFIAIKNQREIIRKKLKEINILRRIFDLNIPHRPTVCGVDGAYAIEKLLSNDMVAIAAVSVEGLTPPCENRYWEAPYHSIITKAIRHDESTTMIGRAIMIMLEYELAIKAPHEVVLLDGSFTTPLIYLNQAINKLKKNEHPLKQELIERLEDVLNYYYEALVSQKTDKIYSAVPKYSVKREIGRILENEITNIWSLDIDDRALMTQVLEPGEYVVPLDIEEPNSKWHLDLSKEDNKLEDITNKVFSALYNIKVLYFKPRSWTPAIRLEVSSSIANTPNRLAILLQAIQDQIISSSVFEPYPLYMADRMVKHIGNVMPAYRQIVSNKMAQSYSGNLSDIFISMHGYRTESGR